MTPEPERQNTLLGQIIEMISREGFEGMTEAFAMLFVKRQLEVPIDDN